MLDTAEIVSFRSSGCLVVRGAVGDDDHRAVREELARWMEDSRNHAALPPADEADSFFAMQGRRNMIGNIIASAVGGAAE